MKHILLILTFLAACSLQAQNLSLTFTSISDARFFVYLNGKLQNERSSGMVTLNNLEDKDYHIRIVIDDPYQVQLTRTLRPSPKHSEYNVLFNAVRERIYLRPAKVARDEELYTSSSSDDDEPAPSTQSAAPPTRTRATLRRTNQEDSVTQRILNRVRTQSYDD